MKRLAVESSMLKSVGFDEPGQILEVEFQTGDVYRYLGVPRVLYEGLLRSSSKGKYFARSVRDRFNFERVR